jgi:hypothetical protein
MVLVAGLASAQEPAGRDARMRPREEIFRMMDAYIADNLQPSLGLTDDQLARALPLVRRLHADRRRYAERRIRALFQMRRLARSGSVTDARAAELLAELRAAETEEAAAVRAGQEALDAVLTPAQQLKYRILEGDIERRLRDAMARVRAQRRNGAGRMRGDDPSREPPDN